MVDFSHFKGFLHAQIVYSLRLVLENFYLALRVCQVSLGVIKSHLVAILLFLDLDDACFFLFGDPELFSPIFLKAISDSWICSYMEGYQRLGSSQGWQHVEQKDLA